MVQYALRYLTFTASFKSKVRMPMEIPNFPNKLYSFIIGHITLRFVTLRCGFDKSWYIIEGVQDI